MCVEGKREINNLKEGEGTSLCVGRGEKGNQ